MHFKTILFIFCFLFSYVKPNTPFADLEKFAQTTIQAECFYLTKTCHDSLYEELKILEQLSVYLNESKIYYYLNKDNLNKKELREFTTYTLLTKEIIRKLEKHLKEIYGWQETDFCSNVIKPIFYSTGITISLIALAKILELTNIIPQENPKKKYATICGTTIASLWILYNYKDQLLRKLSN